MATQQVGFAQLVHQSKWKTRHQLLSGITTRATWYDDNTVITQTANGANKALLQLQPGVFAQDEIMLNSTQTLLLGARADYYPSHGMIYSPRLNYKFQPNPQNTLRLSIGNGFRVVNVFTEDHAALTGARQVIIASNLNPERSINTNLNYSKFISTKKGYINLDAGVFYNYFTNRIIADYDSDPNKIFYNNLSGYAISRGVNVNADVTLSSKLKCTIGTTWMQVFKVDKNALGVNEKSTQIHAPELTTNIQASYSFPKQNITIDYTAQIYSPMRLPVLPNDFRPEYSPWFSLHHVQITKKWNSTWQSYIGVKNLFNFMPQNPIMRPFDPFDKNTGTNNPNGYTFDPSYNYAPLQSIRLLVGCRLSLG
jgi:outer membrane receptor for ferrienterochelin and colicins